MIVSAWMIPLRYCSIEFTDWGAQTIFRDGTLAKSVPHHTNHYHVIAHRCGYSDDILAYCQEHDFVHSFLCEKLFNKPSPIMWALAHYGRDLTGPEAAFEEIATTAFQRWLRAAEEPIVSGVDWYELKAEAARLLQREK